LKKQDQKPHSMKAYNLEYYYHQNLKSPFSDQNLLFKSRTYFKARFDKEKRVFENFM
jgi:hypothetical protein